jgi:hypothetical protein
MNDDDEEYWRVKAEAWRKSIHAERRIDSAPEVRQGEVPQDSLKLGILINQTPALTLTQNDAQLGFSAERGATARKYLCDRGYAAPRGMPRPGKGGRIYVLEPLAPLFAELKLRGIQPFPFLVTRSKSWLHGVAFPLWIQRAGKEVGLHQMWFEREMDGADGKVCFDVVQAREEKLFGVEICLGARNADGIVAYNLKKAEKCAHVDGITHTFLGFQDSGVLKEFVSALKNESAFVQSRVTAISLGEFAPVERKAKRS